MWNKHEVIGKYNKIAGVINVLVGRFLNDPQLAAEGESARLEGQVQQEAGQARRKATEAAKKTDKVVVCSSSQLKINSVAARKEGLLSAESRNNHVTQCE